MVHKEKKKTERIPRTLLKNLVDAYNFTRNPIQANIF